MIFTRKKLTQAIMTLFPAVALVATSAIAQQQPAKVEKIEVTGSNIKRVDTETAAPVQIITREEIERTGQATVAEVLRNIPANMGSFSESFTNSFAPGASGISLRGLGQKTTLVLINGRRTSGYGFAQNLQDTFVDLNSIPNSAVERVEILRDGASAIYGSDAIAGVVNVILRRDFTGAEVGGNVGFYEGKQDYRANFTAGIGDLAKDRFNLFGVFDYYKREYLSLADTEFGKTRDFRGEQGGRNFQSLTGGGTWRQLSPTNALTANQRAITECRGTIIDGPEAVRRGLIGLPVTRTPSSPPGTPNAGYPNGVNALLPFNIPGNTFCSQDFNNQFTALPKTERYGFLARGTMAFSPTLEGYAELGLSRITTFQTFQDPFFAGTTGLTQTAAGLRPFAYNINFAPGVAGNPFSSNARYQGVLADFGTRDLDIESDTLRFLAGLKYSLAGWDGDSAVGWSKNEITQENINRLSLRGVSAVFGVPFTPQPPIPTSTTSPYNLDRPSQNSAAVRDQMRINFPRVAESELTFIDTRVSREFGNLPGGPIGVAAGVEYRREELNDRPDPRAQAGDILGQGITATDGSRNNLALFTEFALPLLKTLEVQAAVRYDRYSDFGSSTNPKIGVKFKPFSTLLLRANWGRGFRAPTLPEISNSVATFFTGVIDPTTGQSVTISGVFAGNPNLQAEKSRSSTVGLVWEPNNSFNIGVDFYQIDWRNQVSSDSFQSVVNAGGPNVIRDPATGNIVTVLNNYRNLERTKTQGVDVDARYTLRTSFGRFTARGTLIYVDKFEEEGVQRAGRNDGSNTIPRVRGNLAIDWDKAPWAFTARMNYIRGYYQGLLPVHFFDPEVSRQNPEFQNGVFPERIDEYFSYDLFGRYDVTKDLSINAAVLNVTDEKPPYDPGFSGTFLYDFSLYDVRGRQYRLGLKYKFK